MSSNESQKMSLAYWQMRAQNAEMAYSMMLHSLKELFGPKDINEMEEDTCLSSSSGDSLGRKEVKKVITPSDTLSADDKNDTEAVPKQTDEAEGTESGAF